LLVGGKDDDLFKKTINPVDIPAIGPEPQINIDGAVQKALTDRTDLQQARKNLEVSDINLEVSQNNIKPQFNLQSSVSSQGQGPNKIEPTLGYTGALGDLVAFNVPTWSFTGNFVYQLGMRTQKANLARAQIQLDQQKAQLKVTELGVVTDVTTAGLNVQNTYKQYIAAQQASTAQQAATEAEQTRFQVGLSNNFNVVTQQNNLTSARLAELTALINYVNAVADYERKQRIGGTNGSSTTGSTTTTGGSL
jgi:outer membrane protein TolC